MAAPLSSFNAERRERFGVFMGKILC